MPALEVLGDNFLIHLFLNIAGLWHVLNIVTLDIRSHNYFGLCHVYCGLVIDTYSINLLV